VHNLALQTVLDTGYFGLLVLVVTAVVAGTRIERLARAGRDPALFAVLAILLVVLFSGTTEALPTYNFPDTLALALLLFAIGAVLADPQDSVPPGAGQVAQNPEPALVDS
jgi:O-antigen ligase